jgi:hypothetical protein
LGPRSDGVAQGEIKAFPIARATIRVKRREIDRPKTARFDRTVNQPTSGRRDALFEIAVLNKTGAPAELPSLIGKR